MDASVAKYVHMLIFVVAVVFLLCFREARLRKEQKDKKVHTEFTFEELLDILEPASPQEVATLRSRYRVVEHGLLTAGLKLHILDEMPGVQQLVDKLGGEHYGGRERPYRRTEAANCIVLPPVGSATAAVQLLECVERTTGEPVFGTNKVQIQVCTPNRLSSRSAAILSIVFYLGTDELRQYTLEDLETTFSQDMYQGLRRGMRLAIYDGVGPLDRAFDYWHTASDKVSLEVVNIPFISERTDILTCRTRVDIQNVNFVASILTHFEHGGWWKFEGQGFVEEIEEMLRSHLLGHLLDAPWIYTATPDSVNDDTFYLALTELMAYAVDEAKRLGTTGELVDQPSLLVDVQRVLGKYRRKVINQARAIEQRGEL